MYEREFPFFMLFDPSQFKTLKELRLNNSKIRNEDVLVQILRNLKKKEIKLEVLDLSGNKLTPFVCKSIALYCRSSRTLTNIFADDTELPLSGLVYLLMVTIDESEPVKDKIIKNKKDDVTELDRLLLDNSNS